MRGEETLNRRPARSRFVPDWPMLMTARTVASYLDCAHDDTGNLKRTFKDWKDLPGFPRPDRATGMYFRPAIDDFLARHFGYADSQDVEADEMNREFLGA